MHPLSVNVNDLIQHFLSCILDIFCKNIVVGKKVLFWKKTTAMESIIISVDWFDEFVLNHIVIEIIWNVDKPSFHKVLHSY